MCYLPKFFHIVEQIEPVEATGRKFDFGRCSLRVFEIRDLAPRLTTKIT